MASRLLLFGKMAHIVLASSSPRRKELLQQLGLDFEIYSPDIDESVHENELVHHYVERLAREKAQTVLKLFQKQLLLLPIQVWDLMAKLLVSLNRKIMLLKSGNNYLDVGMMCFLDCALRLNN